MTPPVLNVNVGDTIAFTNTDSFAHTSSSLGGDTTFPAGSPLSGKAVTQKGSTLSGGWTSGAMQAGTSSQIVLADKPGTYLYGCYFHYGAPMRGAIVAVPKGDVYRSASVRPIRSALIESPEYAAEHSGVISRTPTLFLKMSDPTAFGRFTAAHLNQSLGIYLDDRLISAPELMSPISDSGMITGNFDARELDFIAAVLDAGPLPARVKFISTSGVIRG
jgi:plastocyanin